MSEKLPQITTQSISADQRKAPKYEGADSKTPAPTNPAEWSARLGQIYKEDRMSGRYSVDESNIDYTPEQREEYANQRLADYLGEHVPTTIQDMGYEIDHDFDVIDGRGNRHSTNLEVKNPDSRIGDLMLQLLHPNTRRDLSQKLDEYKAGDPAATKYFINRSKEAYSDLLNTRFAGKAFDQLRKYLDLATLNDPDFIVRQLEGAVYRESARDKEQIKKVNLGAIASTGIFINKSFERQKRKHPKTVQHLGQLSTFANNSFTSLKYGAEDIAEELSKKRESKKLVKHYVKAKKKSQKNNKTADQYDLAA